MKEPPSPFRWAQWHAGTLSSDESSAFETYLQETPEARREDEEHQALHQRLQQRDGFEALLQQGLNQPVQKAPKETSPRKSRWMQWLSNCIEGYYWMPMAAGLCVLLVAINAPPEDITTPAQALPSHTTQQTPKRSIANLAKSAAIEFEMLFMRRGTKRTYKARPHQLLAEGDFIQFTYRTGRAYHVMIASVNAKGEVSRYVPFTGQPQSVNIAIGKGLLPATSSTLELDDSVGPERIFFVYASQPFSFARLQRALKVGFQKANQKLEQISLAGAWRWQSLIFHKRPTKEVRPGLSAHE